FTACLDEPWFGVLACLFGRTQLLVRSGALRLQLGQTSLHGLLVVLQTSEAVSGLAQQRFEFLLAQKTMALRREQFEQLENAPGLAQALTLVFGVLQLLACRFAL